MSSNLFDPSWYRVAELKPRLRNQGHIHRHHYRGDLWYVLQDKATGKYHRFSPVGYQLIGLMNGKHTVQEIYDLAIERLEDEAPTQSEVIQLLGQLHSGDTLQCDVSPDVSEILKRHKKQSNAKIKQTLRTPLAIRIPLFDPEKLLQRSAGLARMMFSLPMMLLWLAVVGGAGLMSIGHWPELTENLADRVLSPSNLVMLWLIFPLVKAAHEMGHALAVKAWGGEVHEMGIMLLVFMPIPYVDASSASAFRQKHRRIIVGAAGMLVELLIAAVAMLIWIYVEPGLVRSIMFNIMLIAGVSTLFFNANPLLKFDGYYMLADTIEIPNFANKSNQYIGFLIQKYLFRTEAVETPVTAKGERKWLSLYSVTSFFYRMFVYYFIILFIASKYFFIGVLLAIWAAYTMFVSPVIKHVKFLASSPKLNQNRGRSILTTTAILSILTVFLFTVPVSHLTTAEGVVWIPEKSIVRAETDGFVQELLVSSGEQVAAGQLLLRSDDPVIEPRLQALTAENDKLKAQSRNFLRNKDHVSLKLVQEKMAHNNAEIVRLQERKKGLEVRAQSSGVFFTNTEQDLPGKFLVKGQDLGFVIQENVQVVRAVVKQDSIDLVRGQTENVIVRIASMPDQPMAASVVREIPSISNSLPSPALSDMGGGRIAIDPESRDEMKAFENIYQLDLEITRDIDFRLLGSRVYVRFDHGDEPLAWQWQRSIRQLFLRQFNV